MNETTIKNVAVYLGSADVHNQVFRQAVIDLADYLADHDMTLVFGGSSCGMMKLLADTMLEHNGKVIGIFTKSLPEKITSTRYISLRFLSYPFGTRYWNTAFLFCGAFVLTTIVSAIINNGNNRTAISTVHVAITFICYPNYIFYWKEYDINSS